MTPRSIILVYSLLLTLVGVGQTLGADYVLTDTTLISSWDYSAIDAKAREYRSLLWKDLTTGKELNPSDLHVRVGLLRKKGVRSFDVLSNREKTLLRFWTGQYDSLLTETSIGIDAHRSYSSMRPKCFSSCYLWDTSDPLNMRLVTYMHDHREILHRAIRSSSLSTSDKDFLVLYLSSVLAYRDLEAFRVDTMLQETKRFLEEHPGSAQELYVRKTLDQQFKPGGFGIGSYFFAGPSYFQGNMSTYFNNTWYIGGELTLSWAKASVTAGFGFGVTRPIKSPFTYDAFDYTTSRKPTSPCSHLVLGYAIWNNTHLRLTPFAGLGGVAFSVEEANDNVVFYGRQAGFDIDWKFSRWQEVVSYQTAMAKKSRDGYLAVRLRVGYERLSNDRDDATFGGSQVFMRIGISLFDGYGRRVKTWRRSP